MWVCLARTPMEQKPPAQKSRSLESFERTLSGRLIRSTWDVLQLQSNLGFKHAGDLTQGHKRHSRSVVLVAQTKSDWNSIMKKPPKQSRAFYLTILITKGLFKMLLIFALSSKTNRIQTRVTRVWVKHPSHWDHLTVNQCLLGNEHS